MATHQQSPAHISARVPAVRLRLRVRFILLRVAGALARYNVGTRLPVNFACSDVEVGETEVSIWERFGGKCRAPLMSQIDYDIAFAVNHTSIAAEYQLCTWSLASLPSGTMKHVLLLRAPEEDGPDRYEIAFRERGYVPLSVPALETVLVHIDALRDKIVRGPAAQGLSGVILTSKRAAEAWREALRSIVETTQADWRTVPFYVVGDATAAAAFQIRTTLPGPHLAPADIRGGADAGTSERLAAFILAEGNGDGEGRRMFYLTGDKNRETLPVMLTSKGIVLDTLEVYRTTGSSTIRADLGAVLERAPVGECTRACGDDRLTAWLRWTARTGTWGWVVHFAPSAAAFVDPVLREVFGVDVRAVKVAAIGPTTAACLRDALGVHVDVVSPKPTPEMLCSAVVASDSASTR